MVLGLPEGVRLLGRGGQRGNNWDNWNRIRIKSYLEIILKRHLFSAKRKRLKVSGSRKFSCRHTS